MKPSRLSSPPSVGTTRAMLRFATPTWKGGLELVVRAVSGVVLRYAWRGQLCRPEISRADAEVISRCGRFCWPGLNCAPWNVIGQRISAREDDDEGVLVANSPLLIYHFQGLRVMRHWAFDLYPSKEVALPRILRERVYRRYVSALIEQMRRVSALERNQSFGIDRDFLGLKGWYIGAKQFAWSRNAMLQFS